ncbi:uncharacterized protein LOC111012188 [Momordica charantia]|uniref:Uncharacterized protein LOC111012188 n=1 Tax=Momordica charantia TaxID=3673 RepID=A0A6J1CL76_MOMCH|nr:uncharacterized protein LOC111012188 [Momordica charantia]
MTLEPHIARINEGDHTEKKLEEFSKVYLRKNQPMGDTGSDLDERIGMINERVDTKNKKMEIRDKENEVICAKIAELNEKWQRFMENSRRMSEEIQIELDELYDEDLGDLPQEVTNECEEEEENNDISQYDEEEAPVQVQEGASSPKDVPNEATKESSSSSSKDMTHSFSSLNVFDPNFVAVAENSEEEACLTKQRKRKLRPKLRLAQFPSRAPEPS